MAIKLSVLICSMPERQRMLASLLSNLNGQIQRHAESVEILVANSCKEAMTTGTKRNKLIAGSSGQFVAFVDDDDRIAPDYLSRILAAIDQDPEVDVLRLEGEILLPGRVVRRFIHSIECDGWYEKDNVYYRTPNHLNPIARRHAEAVPFADIYIGEDRLWSENVRPLLLREGSTSGALYFYMPIYGRS